MSDEKDTQKKIRRRKLTPFLCQEMLFDYALDLLDADRKAAVEEFLKNDQECRAILEGVHAAIAYTQNLGRTRINSEVKTHLRDAENAVSLGRKYTSWREWPETLRWSITALAISFVVAGFVAIVPWHKLPSWKSKNAANVVELAELSRTGDGHSDTPPETADNETDASDQGSGDEEMGDVVAAAPPPPALHKPEVVPPKILAQATPAPTPIERGKTAPTPGPTATVAVAATAATPSTSAVSDTDDSPSPSKKEAKPKGFVYRAFMNIGNLEDIGPKIADHIVELGGEKAGEVELGWKRGTGRYYHFSLPEDSEEKLLEKLRAYGPVRISKDPHGRVMPQGQVRFILWVEPL